MVVIGYLLVFICFVLLIFIVDQFRFIKLINKYLMSSGYVYIFIFEYGLFCVIDYVFE